MRITAALAVAGILMTGVSVASDMDDGDKKPIHIAAQVLEPALQTLAKDRNLQVVYRSEVVGELHTGGASGDLTTNEALRQLLKGTGLSYQYLDDKTVTIVPVSHSQPLSSRSPLAHPIGLDSGVMPADSIRLAQANASADEPESSSNSQKSADSELEEVVVTATKRPESLMRVPQAITAITSERLDELHARSFEDYFREVPGLMFVKTEPIKNDFSLRGIGSGNITANPTPVDVATVAQYLDDISITSGGFQVNPHLVDIERVEVLRGPQGTLYGEGALGGMIRIVTRKPDVNNSTAAVEGRVSSTQDGGVSHDESATLNLPVVTGVAALRLSGFYSYDSGFIDMVKQDDTGAILGTYEKDYDSARASGVRGQFLLKPNDDFSLLAHVVHTDSRTNFGGYFPKTGDLLDHVSTCRPGPPTEPPSSTCVGGNIFYRDETADLYNLTLQGDLGWATLVSSSSYAQVDGKVKNRELNTIAGELRNSIWQMQDTQSFIEELRLVSSKSWSERWDYVLGAFYQDKENLMTSPLPGNGLFTNDLKVKEKAMFFDGGYMSTPKLQARLGLRVSQVNNDGTFEATGEDAREPQYPSSRFNPAPVTGRAVLNYFANQNTMIYGSIARGFRNGVLNNILVNYGPDSQQPGFVPVPQTSRPDMVKTYELGWKLAFPARKATLSGAIFHTDWDNMQVMSQRDLFPDEDLPPLPPGAPANALPLWRFRPVFVNAARSRIDGLELEASLELLKGLQARVSFSYLDAVLSQDFPLYNVKGNPVLHGLKGDRIPFVAKTSGSLGLSYHRPVLAGFNGFVDMNAQYQGSRATDFNRTLNTTPCEPPESPGYDPNCVGGTSPDFFTTYYLLRAYWTTSMQLGVQNAQWRAALYVDNLFNDRADIFHSGDARVTNRPRTIGLSLRRNFD